MHIDHLREHTKVVNLEHVIRISDEIADGVDAEEVEYDRLLLHPLLPLNESKNHKNASEDADTCLQDVAL